MSFSVRDICAPAVLISTQNVTFCQMPLRTLASFRLPLSFIHTLGNNCALLHSHKTHQTQHSKVALRIVSKSWKLCSVPSVEPELHHCVSFLRALSLRRSWPSSRCQAAVSDPCAAQSATASPCGPALRSWSRQLRRAPPPRSLRAWVDSAPLQSPRRPPPRRRGGTRL